MSILPPVRGKSTGRVEFVDGWIFRQAQDQGDGWMGGWVDGWMGGWVDGWIGGWVDGWMGVAVSVSRTVDGRCCQEHGSTVGGVVQDLLLLK